MKTIEADVLKLAELIKRKDDIITDRRILAEQLESDNKPALFAQILLNQGGRDLIKSDRCLMQAVAQKMDWIIDVVYDTAIQNIEKEIALLFEKIQQKE